MYLVYVNDIFNVVVGNFVKCVLHADNIALIISVNSINELFQLAFIYFTPFSKWFAPNKLYLNDSKTHFIIFGALDKAANLCANFYGHVVNRVKFFCYLDLIID